MVKKPALLKDAESRQAEKPLWLTFQYFQMLGRELWETAIVTVTKFYKLTYTVLGASFVEIET
jgi:hypothetical protein